MTRASQELPDRKRHLPVALLLGLAVGIIGIYPHLRWSAELRELAWFFNSYDEGFYGWLAVSEVSLQRGLTDLVMHGLYFASGMNAQLAMLLADFILPLGATLACCYMVRPLFAGPGGMAAGALFVLTSAECLALRSRAIPHSFLHTFLQDKVVPLAGGPAGLLQIDNQTSTFWLFRTPEPQVSWIILFLALGLAVRLVRRPAGSPLPWGAFLVLAVLVGAGYIFCALSLGGAWLLFAVLAVRTDRPRAILFGAAGLVTVAVCLGLSVYAARQSGAESLVFPSHRPVVMISVVAGLAAASLTLLRGWRGRECTPLQLFTLALGLTPLCVANQQLVTGRMIYLLNFENFSLAQLSALACLLSLAPPRPGPTGTGRGWGRAAMAGAAILLLGGILAHSQWQGYRQYLDTNRLAASYAATLQAIPAGPELIVCDDFFETDTLALRLGRRPRFLINRDMIFTRGISRLQNAATAPANGAGTRRALFHYLALTGVSPEDLATRFHAITDPGHPGWQDRFLLGGFLYNHADFWAPFTHGRDTKLPWIEQQKAAIIDDYRRFLAGGESSRSAVIFVLRQDKPVPDFLSRHGARPLAVPPASAPIPMKAFRLEAAGSPGTP